jgi:anti-anti-sigma factor
LQSSVSQLVEGETRTVAVIGELDITTAGEVDRAVREFAPGGDQRLVIDLRGCEFVDSTGLRCLVFAARERGPALFLVDPGGQVARMLDMTGIGKLAEVRQDGNENGA